MANQNFNLTGKKPSDTYLNLVQYDSTASIFVDGVGNTLPTASFTSSYAISSSYSSFAEEASSFSTVGLTTTRSFTGSASDTHEVHILDGLIVDWIVGP